MNSQTKTLSFEAIPVIDLMGGQVVRAQRGQRDRYQPLVSKLCASAEPLEVVRGLLTLHPFRTLYIADIDAIQNRGNHLQTVSLLRNTYPQLNIWVDAGFSHSASCAPWQAFDIHYVIGSESQANLDDAIGLFEQLGRDRAILSLDSLRNQFKGPLPLLENAALWPSRVIAMNLDRVGSHAGPDVELLQKLQHRSLAAKFYAAGGVRNGADLKTLVDKGIAGALIASALHDAHITADDLGSF
jgi:phosphoribosylformimino-5-aminoimidazole carboxamide ribotide isomerase